MRVCMSAYIRVCAVCFVLFVPTAAFRSPVCLPAKLSPRLLTMLTLRKRISVSFRFSHVGHCWTYFETEVSNLLMKFKYKICLEAVYCKSSVGICRFFYSFKHIYTRFQKCKKSLICLRSFVLSPA